MLKFLIAATLTWTVFGHAETLIKTLQCQNDDLILNVKVYSSWIEWTYATKSSPSEVKGPFSGYIIMTGNDLSSFSSTDDGSDVEIENDQATLAYEDQTDVKLTCVQK